TVGFVIPFGKKAEPMAKAEPVPAPKPMPVVKKEAPSLKPVVKKVAPVSKPIVVGDDDHDGVNNNEDLCPNTPVGNVVNSDGCVKVIHLHVNFAFNEAHIPDSYMSQIKKVANFMLINDNYTVVLEGNTDSIGSKKYNQKLSILRANAVADVLEKLGVHPKRIIKKGFGESNPIATNKTKVGRAQNRRVDAKFLK
ncbi:MAG: OmpA family protein, partial [Campylobacteraceae bacterium]|nr:OmpA family protein [Campylobacteraceae bacterium]